YVKGPDFPTGAYIMGMQGIRDAYETGRGRVIIRAKAEIENGDTHDKIVVSEIPYGVNKQQLIEYIAQLVGDKKIEGISNVNDESDSEGMRIVVDLKRDANARVVLNKLFKMTPLQTSFSVNSIALVKGRPQLLTLKDFISNFIEHRHEVTIRRTKYDLRKAEERAHILKGLIIASDNIDEVIQIVKSSKTPQDAQRALEARFGLDELQSKAIVEMRIGQLTGLNQEKLHAEFDELMEKIKYYNQILTDDELCRKVIKDELLEIKAQYGDERRTEILPSAEEFNAEDFYANDEVVITMSHMGYIKRVPLAEFKAQGRGGIGVKASSTRDNDFIEKIYPATMHNTMLFFTDRGRCYWLKVYDIPDGNKQGKGRAIQNMLNIEPGDAVRACLCIRKLNDPEFCQSHYVVFCTKNGIIKKTCLTDYSRVRSNGVNAINIREDDQVIGVELTNGKNEIIIANAGGRAVRFDETQVRPMGRTATGVQSIVLDDDPRDGVVGMCIINDAETESIMVLSENGFGKRTDVEEYRKTSRHAKGVKTLAITEKTGYLVAITVVKDEDDLMIINKSGTTIRLHADVIKETKNRVTQGTKVIELKKRNDVISHLSVVPRADDEPETPAEDETTEQ
ncbi:MAG: DNA gyrase subunit A, partial [Bacteroidaceae bacterium]|nr:DNA gyrase subunit A [Bacteroidaceae bacterium]